MTDDRTVAELRAAFIENGEAALRELHNIRALLVDSIDLRISVLTDKVAEHKALLEKEETHGNDDQG